MGHDTFELYTKCVFQLTAYIKNHWDINNLIIWIISVFHIIRGWYVHSAGRFMQNISSDCVIVEQDLCNAFITVCGLQALCERFSTPPQVPMAHFITRETISDRKPIWSIDLLLNALDSALLRVDTSALGDSREHALNAASKHFETRVNN